MKYIRTKDGKIGKVISVRDYNGGKPTFYHVQFKNDREIYSDYELGIIKQADTIEELCDEYYLVVYDELAKKKVRLSFENCNSAKTHCDRYFKNFDWSIYGAIWTDKGLIYVAKMNDKGELELL